MSEVATTDEHTMILAKAKALSIEDVWAALPEEIQGHSAIMERLKNADPRRAAASYKDYFWEDNPNDAGRKRHSLPDEQLLSLMICLYLHRGGTEPEQELTFWQNIFAT